MSVTRFRAWCRGGVAAFGLALVAVLAAALPSAGHAAVAGWETIGGESVPRGPIRYEHTPRVVGGSFTTAERFPWQAALVLDSSFGLNDFDGQFCGGSLIHPFIVLTAAHCVFDTDPDFIVGNNDAPGGDGTPRLDPNDADIIIGRTQLSAGGGTRHDIQAIYLNQGYNPQTAENDLALISMVTGTQAPTIQIAGPSERATWAPDRGTIVTGYGLTSEGGSPSDTLKEAVVPVIADPTCSGIYGEAFNPALMVCAGVLAGGTDSCQGDSGGPLQAPIFGGGFRLAGVTSFGVGCARPNLPGVYARVADDPLRSGVQGGVDFIVSSEGGIPPGQVIGTGARLPFGCRGQGATIAGFPGDDLLVGTPGRDVIVGLGGNDRIRAQAGADLVCGGAGADVLDGGTGNDQLLGGPQGDVLFGRAGKDLLLGGPGGDRVAGGAGEDRERP